MSDKLAKIAQLKVKGNEYFANGYYESAYRNYTRAIALDDRNAVLYANRAACCLALKRYLEASHDAEKATEIDPTYSKGWLRLAAAYEGMGMQQAVFEAWNDALNSLPQENPSPSQIRLREYFTDGLKKSRNLHERRVQFIEKGNGRMPWDFAELVKPELMKTLSDKETMRSSAWVILGARANFIAGFRAMQELRKHRSPTEPPVGIGNLNALTYLMNAILWDARAFDMPDNDLNLYGQYCLQSGLEIATFRGWGGYMAGQEEDIIQAVQERLRTEGWASTRLSLSTTIRAWLTSSFFRPGLQKIPELTLKSLNNVVAVLRWGREAWKDVAREEKGTIFDNEFIQVILSLRVNTLVEVYEQHPSITDLDILLKEADGILDDIKNNPMSQLYGKNYGLLSALRVYPMARAFFAKGFYHQKMAHLKRKDKDVESNHYKEASSFYTMAARYYPEDDELHVWSCHLALETALKYDGVVLKNVLTLLAHIRLVMPKMKKIWTHSAMSAKIEGLVQKDLAREKDLLKLVERGTLTVDRIGNPLKY